MPVAAVVLTLDASADEGVLARLADDPRLILGARRGARLPIVVDTATAEEGAALLEGLLGVEGVVTFDVVSVDFSDEEAAAPC